MKILVTVLIRSGSKGLPNKHLLQFNGKPLAWWTVKAARIWEYWSNNIAENDADVVLASDSQYILTLLGDGVGKVLRNPEYATDEAGKVDAIRDVLAQRENGKNYDLVIDLDATNPCRRLEDIDEIYKIFKEKQPKTVFSVVKAKKNPYFNQVFLDIRNHPQLAIYSNILCRQGAPECYDINSNIYAYDADWLRDRDNKSVITDNSDVYVMPEWTRCDIDNGIDFKIAEFLHKEYLLKEGNVRSGGKNGSCCGGNGFNRCGNNPISTQARGIYFKS